MLMIGIEEAFANFGGVSGELRFDQFKAVVLRTSGPIAVRSCGAEANSCVVAHRVSPPPRVNMSESR
jgi:hypothetical protein